LLLLSAFATFYCEAGEEEEEEEIDECQLYGEVIDELLYDGDSQGGAVHDDSP
jgi:hypothetical protein